MSDEHDTNDAVADVKAKSPANRVEWRDRSLGIIAEMRKLSTQNSIEIREAAVILDGHWLNLDSIKLLAAASRLLDEKCVSGIEANRERCESYAELTLSAAYALRESNDRELRKRAFDKTLEAKRGRSLR